MGHPEPPHSAARLAPSWDGKLRLLVVDDAALCRKFSRRVIGAHCSEIVEAGNGQEAVERVRESIAAGNPFDGILMDSSMPIMNGTTATRLIRRLGYAGRVFGVTGNAFQADIDDFLAHGADEVLIKPVGADKYAYIIETIRGAGVGGRTGTADSATDEDAV